MTIEMLIAIVFLLAVSYGFSRWLDAPRHLPQEPCQRTRRPRCQPHRRCQNQPTRRAC